MLVTWCGRRENRRLFVVDDRVYRVNEVTEEEASARFVSACDVFDLRYRIMFDLRYRIMFEGHATSRDLTRCRGQPAPRSRRPKSWSRGQNRNNKEKHKTIAVMLRRTSTGPPSSPSASSCCHAPH